MAKDITQKVKTLIISAKAKGHFVVEATAARLLDDPTSLDYQINLIGALHEVQALRNVLKPYWQMLRVDEEGWALQCLSRLLAYDHDGWALAALLGLSHDVAVSSAKKLGLQVITMRRSDQWDQSPLHIASMTLPVKPGCEKMLTPLLELGWNSKTDELVDCVRARAVLLAEQSTHEGSLIGKGKISYFCRASLPYGVWRSLSSSFEINREEILPNHQHVVSCDDVGVIQMPMQD
ncbi:MULTISPECIES: hypothetical protein [Pseudomonas syringae group]|uniref:hypothetical protein n=3 Tax=Pseudomonas TaxID=286 RepID=UPI0006D5DE6C|nr:hypothetical protein [Pseudomonas coronafaciens]KPX35311.1 hypothetical protein ALO77_200092 [Pseudomonas coronafaciens pv. garcae]RMS94048.1 hypothetical protein ALP57_200120 [Pseudomonas coronafaciens pv. oryzae]RMV86532.1 hypothetical protein ALP02_00394 [Pseudomonas coronafaciens pv. garcae]